MERRLRRHFSGLVPVARSWDYDYDELDRLTFALCRKTREDRPGGDYTTFNYLNLGLPKTPATQYIETRRRAPTASDTTIWSREYIDGFGRP